MQDVIKLTPLVTMAMMICFGAGCDDDAGETAPSTSASELRKFIQVPGEPRGVMWDTVTFGDERSLAPGPVDWGLVAYIDYAQGSLREPFIDEAVTVPEARISDLLLRDWLPARVKAHLSIANGAIVAKTLRGLRVLSPSGIGKSPLIHGCILVNQSESWCVVMLYTM